MYLAVTFLCIKSFNRFSFLKLLTKTYRVLLNLASSFTCYSSSLTKLKFLRCTIFSLLRTISLLPPTTSTWLIPLHPTIGFSFHFLPSPPTSKFGFIASHIYSLALCMALTLLQLLSLCILIAFSLVFILH